MSVASFRAGLRRVDLRIDRSGQPFVVEINTVPGLGMRSPYVLAAKTTGHSFSSLVNRILDVA
ncbi:hypothetical protein [Mesorhizobium sp. M8A.F.Ca.ET.165.01.1.1]|uniref:hypothetical protein n=1 Tax=Mesorhizobium sp. M8A.F.Ca.ET.165.01.1.1 TaxID=2563960 RepID=UPI00247A7FED|nr:hypothetical protein [Mesorhizobium sp. M8A.F.Ca.ET.165.01.1.1]